MFDLNVAPRRDAGRAPGLDVLTVHTVGSLHDVAGDEVLIRHVAPSGRVEEVHRPATEAVPLFWRLATEKWGVAPWRWDTLTAAQRRLLGSAVEGGVGPLPSFAAASRPLGEEAAELRDLGLLRPGPPTDMRMTPAAREWYLSRAERSGIIDTGDLR